MLQDQYATIDGIQIHYMEGGSGQTLLFLHGFPEFWYAWNALLPGFSQDYRVVAPDLRGYNLSARPQEASAYTVPALVADIRGLLDQISPERPAILVGHDWGGIVAWAFAIACPEYLEKLVIINAPHPAIFARELAHNPAQQRAAGYMAALRSPEAEAMLRADTFAGLDHILFDGARSGAFSEEDRAAYHAAWSQPGALTGALNYYRTGTLPPPPRRSFMVQVPTLVLWGEQDTALLTGNLDGLDDFVLDLRVERFPQGSHWLVHEEPEAVTRAIRTFIAS